MVSSIESHFDDGITFDFSIDTRRHPIEMRFLFLLRQEKERESEKE